MPRKRAQDNSSRYLLFLSAFVVAMVLLVALSMTYMQAKELSEHRKAVIRTQHLITLLTRLESAMYMVESHQRGYLITGRVKYLRPFKESKNRVSRISQSVEEMLAKNSAQESRLVEMKMHIDKKLDELQRTVDLRRTGHNQEAKEIVLTDKGQLEMEAFVLSMREMKKEENRILRIQSRRLEEAASEALNRLIQLAFVSLAAFLVGFRYITRVDKSRRMNRLTQQVLFDVSSIMAKSEDLSTSIRGILEAISDQFNWQVGVFWRENENENNLTCNGFFSRRSREKLEELINEIKVEEGQGLAGRAWSANLPLWSRDVTEDDTGELIDQIKQEGLHSAFAIPINAGEDFAGIFEFFSSSIEKPDLEQIEAFSLVGVEIGQLVQRRDIEDKLQKSLTELAKAKGVMDSVLDNMSSGVIYVDTSGKIGIFNRSAEMILGSGSRESNFEQWKDKIYYARKGNPVEYDDLPIIKALRGESTRDIAIKIVSESSNHDIIVNVNGRPVRDENGNIIGGVIVVDDITERHQAEKRVSEFYSMVSHELRTPLTSIKGSLRLLEGGKGGELSGKARRLVTLGRQECDRLVRLINDILDIRKIEAGKLELKRACLNPEKVVDEVIESMSSYAEEHSVNLVKSNVSSHNINADRDRVAQVLNNLISNAIKFSPENADVIISTESKEESVRFLITDRGPGISEKEQHKLFRIFQQLNSSNSRPKGGTGLGLAICKALVEQHEGSIGLESEPGKGSTFWFEIARYKLQSDDNGKTESNTTENPEKIKKDREKAEEKNELLSGGDKQ